MFPFDIDVAAECKHHSIHLGEVNFLSGLCAQESELSRGAQGTANSDVLIFGSLWVERSRIMMEWLPVRGTCVPIEPGSHAFLRNPEVVGHHVLNLLESGTAAWVLRNEMRAFMPADPVGFGIFFLTLYLAHLFNGLVLEAPVVLLAENFRHNHHIIVLYRFVEYGSVGPNDDSHIWADKCALRVEGFRVTARSSVFLSLSLLSWILFESRVVPDIFGQVGVAVFHN